MKFNDFTLANGRVHSKRIQYTERLERRAIVLCSSLIKILRVGELEVAHGVDGLPPFLVSLGTPEYLRESLGSRVDHHVRIFCIRMPGAEKPFQINLILGPGSNEYDPLEPGADLYAIGTVCALSGGHEFAQSNFERLEATCVEVLNARPVLATMIDARSFDRISFNETAKETIKIAADFSTCFAAAMLLEQKGTQ
jgi:hypothetical protein